MSRIRQGLHEVIVYPRTTVEDAYGDIATGELDPVTVQCNVQPASAEEISGFITGTGAGVGAVTVYRIKYWPREHGGLPWPGGASSRISIAGTDYEQRGEPLISRMGGSTAHVKIYAASYAAPVR